VDAVTREVFKVLRERRDKLAHMLGEGGALGDQEQTGVAVGRYSEIGDLLSMEFDDMKEAE
jgi:hypothetical protein